MASKEAKEPTHGASKRDTGGVVLLEAGRGLSAAKGRLSGQIGIPLTKSGRQRKVGKAMGWCAQLIAMVLAAAGAVTMPVAVGRAWASGRI